MLELSTRFGFEARYFQSAELNVNTKSVWFVLHGYGQLAKYFARKFDPIAELGVCVVAPEGLSRFYLEDIESRTHTGNNRVGSTWMTRENREMDIRNYLEYLDSVYREVMGESKIPVTILGFSQGAATASRWAIHTSNSFERLILYAGIFPPDMDFAKGHEKLSARKVQIVFGSKDPYITDPRIAEQNMLTSKLGISPTIHTFDGGHDIDANVIKGLV